MFKKVFRETDRFDFMSLLDSLSPKFEKKTILGILESIFFDTDPRPSLACCLLDRH